MRFDARWQWAGRSGIVRDIDLTWTERDSRDGRRVAVSLPIGADIDVPGVIASGIPLTTMRVSIEADGVEVLSGLLRAPVYGAAGEPVEGDVGDVEADDTGTVPPAGLVMSLQAFPFATSIGSAYPWPFGTAGLLSDGTEVPATPALIVDQRAGYERLLVAGFGAACSQVRIWGPLYKGSEVLTSRLCDIEPTQDLFGRPVSTVNATSFGQLAWPAWDVDATYYCSWPEAPQPGRVDRLAARLLGLSTLPTDGPAQAAQAAALSRLQAAGYVDDQSAPIDVLQGVLAALPVALRVGRLGRYLASTGLALEAESIAHELVMGRGVHLDSRIAYVPGDPASRVRIEYGLDAAKGTLTQAVEVVGSVAGGRQVRLEAGHLYDQATAYAAANAILAADSSWWREVSVVCDEDRSGWGGPRELRAGQVVALTDAARGLTEQRARVVALERARTGLRVTLRMRG